MEQYESWYDKTEEGKAARAVREYGGGERYCEPAFWGRYSQEFDHWEKMPIYPDDPENCSSYPEDRCDYFAVLRDGSRVEVDPTPRSKRAIYESAVEVRNPLKDYKEKEHSEYVKREYERLFGSR